MQTKKARAIQGHVTRALGSDKEHSTTSLGKVSAADAAMVRERTGVDIVGYERVLQSSGIRHVINSHGAAEDISGTPVQPRVTLEASWASGRA